jgi:hypothetical protein
MTVAALAKTIRHLSAKEQAKLFDRLGAALEDYLLAKIALDRFKPQKRPVASLIEKPALPIAPADTQA